jgi:hypothetical protein
MGAAAEAAGRGHGERRLWMLITLDMTAAFVRIIVSRINLLLRVFCRWLCCLLAPSW